MSFTTDDIAHLAKLARLPLTPEEIKKFTTQLSSIVDYANEIDAVDTKDIAPTSQTTGLENVYRDDTLLPSLPSTDALSGTDDTKNGYIRVDAIFEKKKQ